MLLYNSEIHLEGHLMNEKNNINRLRKMANHANKRFTELEKPSKILIKLGSIVLSILLLAALCLSIAYITGNIGLNRQVEYIEWIVLYSFRFWAITIIGALILDVLLKKK